MMYCFIESENADIENLLIYLFTTASMWNRSFTIQSSGEVVGVLNLYV